MWQILSKLFQRRMHSILVSKFVYIWGTTYPPRLSIFTPIHLVIKQVWWACKVPTILRTIETCTSRLGKETSFFFVHFLLHASAMLFNLCFLIPFFSCSLAEFPAHKFHSEEERRSLESPIPRKKGQHVVLGMPAWMAKANKSHLQNFALLICNFYWTTFLIHQFLRKPWVLVLRLAAVLSHLLCFLEMWL